MQSPALHKQRVKCGSHTLKAEKCHSNPKGGGLLGGRVDGREYYQIISEFWRRKAEGCAAVPSPEAQAAR